MTTKKRIGLLFGSFNPIHIGHLIVANFMVENTNLEKVWFVVSPQNPFKEEDKLLNKFDRYEMVKLATADNDNLEASDIEFDMPKPSYTIDTLRVLTKKFPDTDFVVIVGEDNLQNFRQWKQYSNILESFGLYVYPRFAVAKQEIEPLQNTKLIQAPLIEISSTYIRECIKNKKSIQYLVPKTVERLINAKGLYH